MPAGWFQARPPGKAGRAARTGRLSLEVVSHCWRYSHLLAYQLSSIVRHPPSRLSLTVTVFYAEQDKDTIALLRFFETMQVPNVTWNWQVLEPGRLFRRAIGRNRAARATRSDWIWFTDCDVVFHQGCFDTLAETLQGRRDSLVFPRTEHCSAVLEPSDPVLTAAGGQPRLVDIDPEGFRPLERDRATGPLQITHGDVARACGYCGGIGVYQRPSRSWAKAHEDRAYRWLLRTQGEAVDVPGVYRIRHRNKGRYQGNRLSNWLRTAVRRVQLTIREGGEKRA